MKLSSRTFWPREQWPTLSRHLWYEALAKKTHTTEAYMNRDPEALTRS